LEDGAGTDVSKLKKFLGSSLSHTCLGKGDPQGKESEKSMEEFKDLLIDNVINRRYLCPN
jgi:hypothetical protein